MPLDFAEFAHHYQESDASDEQQRAHFDAVTGVLECVVRLFWEDASGAQRLGITLDDATLSLGNEVDSDIPLHTIFNEAAANGVHAPFVADVVGPGFTSLMALGAMSDHLLKTYVERALA